MEHEMSTPAQGETSDPSETGNALSARDEPGSRAAALAPEEIFAAVIRLISDEIPQRSDKRQRLYRKVVRVLAMLQRRAQRHAQGMVQQPPLAVAQAGRLELRAWGLHLRRRREALDLTRAQLAALSGVADSTIRNIETGRHTPTRAIVLRLQAVEALKLPALFGEEPTAIESTCAPTTFPGHCWLAPDLDAVEQSLELKRVLDGNGGRLDPSLLFFEPASAAAWQALTSTSERLRDRACMPLAAIASTVSARLANVPAVDLLGLAAGEAHAEVDLAQALCASTIASLRLVLLDSSPALLTIGFRRASRALAGQPRASCAAVVGDLRKLPTYAPLLEPPRHRLVCLLGDAFGCLENEASFMRHSLGVLGADDLLLLEVQLALAVPQDEPHLQPDALTGPGTASLVDFLTGPIQRHSVKCRGVELSACLDSTTCVVPGSYAVDYQATVRTLNRPLRRFSVYSPKRYDLIQLIEVLAGTGWTVIERWNFGDAQRPRALLLLQKRV